jgi:L-ornithine Nalpha-acyltransferase
MNIAAIQGLEQNTLAHLPGALPALPAAGQSALGRIGSLTARLARTKEEVRAARELRWRVFFADTPKGFSPCEEDRFDGHCDHLLVFDQASRLANMPAQEGRIVGTYRLLRQDKAVLAGGYCSQAEFDVQSLISRHPRRRFLELGRSCVLPEYRSKRTAELLWQGIWAYCQIHCIDVMFGCASFPGILPARHALPLSLLFQHARAEGVWGVEPVSALAVSMDLVPAEAVSPKRAFAAMPPLIKGYLRLGAKFSGSAVVDPHFCTTDVLVVLRTEDIAARYLSHYGQEAGRFV